MEELDWSVGEILRTLDETGLSEKTLVILTSDNGPWLRYGHHGGSSGGLREGKVTTWEGGVRVPCIMRWKGHIQPGTVSSQLASTIDLLPTISALCGAALPSAKIDGIDISTVLRNGANESPRDHFAYYWGDNLHAVRKGHWKLVYPHTYYTIQNTLPGNGGWPGEQKTLPTGLALYNLQTDPGETIDLKEAVPDKVKELEALAAQYRNELGDGLTGTQGLGKRAPAMVQR